MKKIIKLLLCVMLCTFFFSMTAVFALSAIHRLISVKNSGKLLIMENSPMLNL